MNALVAGAAPVPGGEGHYRELLAKAEIVVACDAAAEWCVGLGRTPDVAIGDFDSAAPGAPDRLRSLGVTTLVFPQEKDESDLDLAVAEARRLGAKRLTITAAYSGRLDHTLAALGALLRCADLEADLDEPDLAAWALDSGFSSSLKLVGEGGSLLSVFAIDGAAKGVTLSGVRYELAEATLDPLSSLGLSNVLSGGNATVRVSRGELVVLSPGPPEGRAKRREA